jgi:hypothetical protein
VGDGVAGNVLALAEFDSTLYVGGLFFDAGGVVVNHVARWDGKSFSSLGDGLGTFVEALAVFDDGTGEALYAAGSFSTAGGVPANRVARWDGATWSAVGAGVTFIPRTMAVFDDGGGPALYLGGSFNSGLVRWDGQSWETVGGGTGGWVYALAVFDDGTGPALYAGGFFSSAGGVAARGVARWDGASWSPLAVQLDPVINLWIRALTVHDDGSGPALYVAGNFDSAGGLPLDGLARWDGRNWTALGAAIDHIGHVRTLLGVAEAELSEPALFVGGVFANLTPVGDSYLARLVTCSLDAWSDEGFGLAGASGTPVLAAQGSLQPGSANHVDLSAAAPVAMAGLFYGFESRPFPFLGGTLAPNPFLGPVITATDRTGTIPLSFLMADVLPGGTELWIQWAILDEGAPQGVALSNAVLGSVP